jgi:hypothetical protein
VSPTKPGSWPRAAGKAVLIFAYFVIATVWLPSRLLGVSFISSAPAAVRDLVGSGVWFGFLVAGMWTLRNLQAKGWI